MPASQRRQEQDDRVSVRSGESREAISRSLRFAAMSHHCIEQRRRAPVV